VVTKSLTNLGNPAFTYKKDGIFYYSRRVPSDLRNHYSKPRIVQSLRTRSQSAAARASLILTSRLEEYWLSLRVQKFELPKRYLISGSDSSESSTLPNIQEALEEYFRLKGEGKDKYFYALTNRNIGYLIECLGIRSLDLYSTADAARLRDWLVGRNLSPATIKRIFSTIKSVINLFIAERGLDIKNPFSGVYLPAQENKKTRHPISFENINKLRIACEAKNDELRWLVALLIDSGMRLSEALGLKKSDLCLNDELPYVSIREHEHRRLKTANSVRKVPLIGISLWAANQINQRNGEYCFPRYVNADSCNRNSASAALNKWVKTVCQSNDVIHGLRHAFRDRLRAVQTPSEVIDQLGGWSHKSIGESYGDGYPLDVLMIWMKEIESNGR